MTISLERAKSLIRPVQDFPKKGILFQDIFPVFQNPEATRDVVSFLVDHIRGLAQPIDTIVGLDSRGFLLGPWIASQLNVSFVPVRKAGKLPPPTHKVSYELEYGSDSFEISQTAISSSSKVVILDDLIATGGSAGAAESLIKKCGGTVVENIFLIELTGLSGRKKLSAPVFSLFTYDD